MSEFENFTESISLHIRLTGIWNFTIYIYIKEIIVLTLFWGIQTQIALILILC